MGGWHLAHRLPGLPPGGEPVTASNIRRAVLAGLDQGDGTPVTDRIDRVLTALDRAGFTIITKADALAAARCANTVNLAAAWTHDPEPVTEDVEWICWSSHLNCQAMADEARTQAIEALETP